MKYFSKSRYLYPVHSVSSLLLLALKPRVAFLNGEALPRDWFLLSHHLLLQLALAISFHEGKVAIKSENYLTLVHSLVHQVNSESCSGKSKAVKGDFRDISLAAVLRSFVNNWIKPDLAQAPA